MAGRRQGFVVCFVHFMACPASTPDEQITLRYGLLARESFGNSIELGCSSRIARLPLSTTDYNRASHRTIIHLIDYVIPSNHYHNHRTQFELGSPMRCRLGHIENNGFGRKDSAIYDLVKGLLNRLFGLTTTYFNPLRRCGTK